MAIKNTLSMCEGVIGLFFKRIIFVTALDLNSKRLKQIRLSRSLRRCAPISELPSIPWFYNCLQFEHSGENETILREKI